jgi:hypothetical protein
MGRDDAEWVMTAEHSGNKSQSLQYIEVGLESEVPENVQEPHQEKKAPYV